MSEAPVEQVGVKESILASTKKILNIDDEATDFDVDILFHINSALNELTQIGVGPPDGYVIESRENTWLEFLGTDINFSSAKTYVYLRVRLLFDPPSTSYHITSLNEQLRMLAYRLNVEREGTQWVEPQSSLSQP